MLVAISGPPGSGKTTLGKLLAKALGLEFVSTGQIFREMAKEKGMGLEEFSKLAETDSSLDRQLDSRQVELAKAGNKVIEGRLSCLLPEISADFRVWVDADKTERARRISKRDGTTAAEALAELDYREASEKKRYLDYYNISLEDKEAYDFQVDTTDKTPAQSLEAVLGAIGKKVIGKKVIGKELIGEKITEKKVIGTDAILKKEGKEMDTNKFGIGSVCTKTRGRDKGECVILGLKENRALVTGPKSLTGVRRRYVNISHLLPTGRTITVAQDAPDEKVAAALGKTLPPAHQAKPKQKPTARKEIKRLTIPRRKPKAAKKKEAPTKAAPQKAAPKKEAPAKPEPKQAPKSASSKKAKPKKTIKTAKPKKPTKSAKAK